MEEKEVHVRLLRPLKYKGEDHGIGDDLVMPRLLADSLVRHRAAKIVAGGSEPEKPTESTERPRKPPQKPRPSSGAASRKKSAKKKSTKKR